VLLVLDDDDI
jgi:hypothetical protein